MNFPNPGTVPVGYIHTHDGRSWKLNADGTWDITTTDPMAEYTAEDVLMKVKTVDGPGSGLDADLLDGQEGSFYQDLGNATGILDESHLPDSIGLTGIPTAPTAPLGTQTEQVASTAYVVGRIANDAPTKTGGGASGTWGINISGNAANATYATGAGNASASDRLSATDDRDVKPNTTGIHGVRAIKPFFAAREMMEGAGTGSDYGDLLVLDTYTDNSGGKVNALFFDKNEQKILHYQGGWNGATWDAPKELAYTDTPAPRLLTPRTISLSGDASGNVSFDGSGNVTLAVTVLTDSHDHTNLDGTTATQFTIQEGGSAAGGLAIHSGSGAYLRWSLTEWQFYSNWGGGTFSNVKAAGFLRSSDGVSVSYADHAHTKADVGLGNVDNTSDVNKPVSTAQATALGLKLDATSYTASDVLAKLLTVDGAGSGLNADLLDGLNSTEFLRSNNGNSTDLIFATGSGRGVRFWTSDEYKIFMSHSGDASFGGRFTGETTSDYNMHFRMGMSNGVNRGFIFENSLGSKLFAINPDKVRSLAPIQAPSFEGNLTGAVTGNASTATKLFTARNFSLTGPVTATAVSFDGTGNVSLSTAIADAALSIAKTSGLQSALDGKISSTLIGAANGLTPLGADSKIPAQYLPSYVDDVLEYTNYAGFPATGETGKMYVRLDTGQLYRWSGSTYIEISSAGTADTATRWAVARVLTLSGKVSGSVSIDGSSDVTLNVTGLSGAKADVGLGNVDNTSDLSKPVSTATQNALNLKLDSSGYTAADVLTKVKTVDGSGSGLDADLLDGQQGSWYQDLANATGVLSVLNSFSANIGRSGQLRLNAIHLLPKYPTLQLSGGSTESENNPASIGMVSTGVGAASSRGSEIYLVSSRSTIAQLNAGTYSAVQANDSIGAIHFVGDDGVSLRGPGSTISSVAMGNWSNTSRPSAILLGTTPIGGNSPGTRMIIGSEGNVTIGLTEGIDRLHVKAGTYASNQDIGMRISTPGTEWTARFAIKSTAGGVPRTAIDVLSNNVGGTVEGLSFSSGGAATFYSDVTGNSFITTGTGEKFRVGDDASIHDINVANTLGIKGLASPSLGYIRFGSDTSGLGWNGSDLVYGTNKVIHEGNVKDHKYHTFVTGQYFFDDYSQGNYFRLFVENARSDTMRFRPITEVEYWDGAAWVEWVGGDVFLKNLFDGREDTQCAIDHTHRKFRFVVNKSTGWTATAILVLQSNWSPITYPSTTVTLENQVTGVWTVKDTAVLASPNTGNGWGTHVKVVNGMHDGQLNTRVTIDITDWADVPASNAYAIPLHRLMLLSNYQGAATEPYSWNYDRVVDFKATPTMLGSAIYHAGNDGAGSGLDADLLDGQQGSWYQDLANSTGNLALTKLPTIATASFLGRNTGGTGTPEVLTTTTARTLLSINNLDNTSDLNKPVSNATQTALNLKADKANPSFTGNITMVNDDTGLFTNGGGAFYKKLGGGLRIRRHNANTDPMVESYDGTQAWTILHAGNFDPATKLDSTANAASATKLLTARTIGLSGVISATGVAFDGTGNITLSTTVADSAFSIAKVAGLQTALDNRVQTSALAVANGVATLGADSKVLPAQMPSSIASADRWTTARSLTLTGKAAGAVSFDGSANVSLNVTSLTVSKADVGLGSVDNTSDLSKPVSTATQTALNGKLTYQSSGGAAVDVDTIVDTRLHVGSTQGWMNRPPAADNSGALLSMNTHSGTYLSQLWFDTNGDDFYHRTNSNGTVRNWAKVWTSKHFDPANKLDASVYTTADVLAKVKSADGSGSGLDADLLDGLDSTYFLAKKTNSAIFSDPETYAVVTATEYKKLGTIYENNGQLRVIGTLGGHTPTEGRATVDLNISLRNGLRVSGTIIGKVGTGAWLEIRARIDDGDMAVNATSQFDVFLCRGNFYQSNVQAFATGSTQIDASATWSATVPTGAIAWSLATHDPGHNGVRFVGDIPGSVVTLYAGTNQVWDSSSFDPSSKLDTTANAVSATKLATARSIALTGVITATGVNFDGTGNISLSTAIADNALSIAKTSGLQTALNAKQSSLGFTPENAANKGVANGYAGLGADGKVPAAQLPSYVDDVLEYASFSALPTTGETGKMYVTLDNNRTYRWSGSIYVEISASPGTTDAVPEGSTNLYFTTARALATITGGASTIASSNLGANFALISNASGKVAVSAVTATELGYLDGVTSSIQTQLGNKLDKLDGVATGSLKITSAAGSAVLTLEADTSNTNESGNPTIVFSQDGGLIQASMGFDANNYFYLQPRYVGAAPESIHRKNSAGTLYALWDSGNDGAGSGLDADLLDGIQATGFVNTNQTQTITGEKTFQSHLYGMNQGSKSSVIGGFVADLHPESTNQFTLPYFSNDLAYLVERGGTLTTNHPDWPNGSPNWFDGSPLHTSINKATIPAGGMVITMTLPNNLAWGTKIGITFGPTSWRARSIKCEVFSITANAWVTADDTTGWDRGVYQIVYGSDGSGINGIRFTLDDWDGSGARISEIWALNYASRLGKMVFVGRDGGDLYGTLKFNTLTANQMLELDGSKNVISVAKASGYNLAVGTTAGTVAAGNHTHTKADVGLGNVDNTSDLSKPVSTATQTALNLKLNSSSYTAIDIITKLTTVDGPGTGLDADVLDGQEGSWYQNASNLNAGTIAAARLPAYTGDVTSPAGSTVTTLANGVVTLAKMANFAANSIMGNNTGVAATPIALSGASVKTMLALVKADVGLASVDNTSDVNKPVSTAQQTALNLKANLASPAFSGTPTAPTAAPGTDTTQLATTAYVMAAVSGLSGGGGSYVDLTTAQSIGGVKTFTSPPMFSSASLPSLRLYATGNALDQKRSNIFLDSDGALVLNSNNDANDTSLASIRLNRDGTQNYAAGGIFPNGITVLQTVGGGKIVSGPAGRTLQIQPGSDSIANPGTASLVLLDYAGNQRAIFPEDGTAPVALNYSGVNINGNAVWHAGNLTPALDNAVVKLSGAQTIAGAKTFTNEIVGSAGASFSGDVLVSKDNAWFTLDSNSAGANGVEQSAGISIGESGYKGAAAVHLTYTGDGKGHLGMGLVDPATGLPANEVMTMGYTSNVADFKAVPTINAAALNYTHLAGTVPDAALSGTGLYNVGRIRANATGDVTLAGDAHALQAGPSGGLNIAIDANEIMARNNGALSQLNFQLGGGVTHFGGTVGLGGDVQFGATASVVRAANLQASLSINKLGQASAQIGFVAGTSNVLRIANTYSDGTLANGVGIDIDSAGGLTGPGISAAASNNTIVKRHASGYIFANYFNTTADVTAAAPTHVMVETGGDSYIRKQTVAVLAGHLRGTSAWNGDPAGDYPMAQYLRWKNYGSGHVIIDASQGTSPTGSAIDKSNASVAWGVNYPSLMGWNGTQTYGLRVDSARVADLASNSSLLDGKTLTSAGTANTVCLRNTAGDIVTDRLFRTGYGDATTISGAIAYRVNNTTDNYIRFCNSGAAVRNWMGVGTADNVVFNSVTAGSVFVGYDSGVANSVSCSGWFRASGASGLYCATYGGGIYMTDATYVRTYGSKQMAAADFVISSDERLKTEIRDFEFRGRLRPVNYSWRKDGRIDFGFVAQEVRALYPEAVGEIANEDPDGPELIYQLSYQKLTAVLSYQVNELEDAFEIHVQELKEAKEKITQLEAESKVTLEKVATLEESNTEMRERLAKLEALVAQLLKE